MNAQLTVLKSGTLRVGAVNPSLKSLSSSKIAGESPEEMDSLAVLNLVGKGYNGGGAYVTFGNGKKVLVGELCDNQNAEDSDVIYIYGDKGIKFGTKQGMIFSYDSPVASDGRVNKFKFGCDLLANSYLKCSDSRLSRDITDIDNLGVKLNEILPISYKFTNTLPYVNSSLAKDVSELSSSNDRIQYGFVAQEVKEIFPDLVVEDENGYLSIDYIGFIPILVDAYKNLEKQVMEQSEVIAALSNNKIQRISSRTVDDMPGICVATLYQNKPNPFKETTTIQCVIPDESSEAFICIYDLQGSQVMRMDISEKGNCSVLIDGLSLKPGMYIYALIVDGVEIDSKRMILTD